MITQYDIIKSLVRTEKGTTLEAQGKYLFHVDPRATKIDVKKAVQQIYNVTVEDVKTLIVPGKEKRVRQELGKTPDWKKAYVTLKEGQKIEIA